MSEFTEWCVWFGGEDPNDCAGLLIYDSEAEARETAQWISSGRVAWRIVKRTAWSAASIWSEEAELFFSPAGQDKDRGTC